MQKCEYRGTLPYHCKKTGTCRTIVMCSKFARGERGRLETANCKVPATQRLQNIWLREKMSLKNLKISILKGALQHKYKMASLNKLAIFDRYSRVERLFLQF